MPCQNTRCKKGPEKKHCATRIAQLRQFAQEDIQLSFPCPICFSCSSPSTLFQRYGDLMPMSMIPSIINHQGLLQLLYHYRTTRRERASHRLELYSDPVYMHLGRNTSEYPSTRGSCQSGGLVDAPCAGVNIEMGVLAG